MNLWSMVKMSEHLERLEAFEMAKSCLVEKNKKMEYNSLKFWTM